MRARLRKSKYIGPRRESNFPQTSSLAKLSSAQWQTIRNYALSRVRERGKIHHATELGAYFSKKPTASACPTLPRAVLQRRRFVGRRQLEDMAATATDTAPALTSLRGVLRGEWTCDSAVRPSCLEPMHADVLYGYMPTLSNQIKYLSGPMWIWRATVTC